MKVYLILILDQEHLDKPITEICTNKIDALYVAGKIIHAILNEDEDFLRENIRESLIEGMDASNAMNVVHGITQDLLSLNGSELIDKFEEAQGVIKVFIREQEI